MKGMKGFFSGFFPIYIFQQKKPGKIIHTFHTLHKPAIVGANWQKAESKPQKAR